MLGLQVIVRPIVNVAILIAATYFYKMVVKLPLKGPVCWLLGLRLQNATNTKPFATSFPAVMTLKTWRCNMADSVEKDLLPLKI